MNTEKLEEQHGAKITKRDIDLLNIPPGSRIVLIRIDNKNVDARTESGIWKIAETDTDWNKSVHSDRVGTAMKVPKDPLPFEVGRDFMPWKTKVEVSEGMTVWFDFLASENVDVYIDEDDVEYKLVDYSDIYVATLPRFENEDFGLQESTDGKEYIIPLNGYHLFETVEVERKGKYDISPSRIDPGYGIVKYLAKNNTQYENNMSEDHLDLQVGDKVRFGNVPAVYLEDEMHCTFDGGRMYRRSQVRNVEMLWRKGEIILPKGKVLIRQKEDENITPTGIILSKPNVKSHTGEVVISSNDDIVVGSCIKYIKGSGKLIDFKGEKCRILTEGCILYVE